VRFLVTKESLDGEDNALMLVEGILRGSASIGKDVDGRNKVEQCSRGGSRRLERDEDQSEGSTHF
jgi:hypothetical protein